MSESTDLVVLAKTWIQAPKDSTPIEFEEVWDLDGSTHRGTAKLRLEKVFGDLCKYGLANNLELVEISTTPVSPNSPVKSVATYLMSYNVFKHYISSSQTERGYKTRAKLIRAEEELERIKSSPMSPGEMMVFQAQQFLDMERRQKQVEQKIEAIAEDVAGVRHEMYANTGYVSMKGYCHMRRIGASLRVVNRYGSMATVLANRIGIVLGKVADERWGSVNSYPISFLDENWETITNQVEGAA